MNEISNTKFQKTNKFQALVFKLNYNYKLKQNRSPLHRSPSTVRAIHRVARSRAQRTTEVLVFPDLFRDPRIQAQLQAQAQLQLSNQTTVKPFKQHLTIPPGTGHRAPGTVHIPLKNSINLAWLCFVKSSDVF